eukprot:GHRR01033269.1.p2 GENE.GHRR01033269.1~~GHRR01033269.1.p2  ORF type:complete len:135 (+),score=45.13 GHRR01033269.1:326-730(+)
MHKYRLVAKKGEGTFSEVLKAQCIKNSKYVAIKCMKNHFDSLEQVGSKQPQAGVQTATEDTVCNNSPASMMKSEDSIPVTHKGNMQQLSSAKGALVTSMLVAGGIWRCSVIPCAKWQAALRCFPLACNCESQAE